MSDQYTSLPFQTSSDDELVAGLQAVLRISKLTAFAIISADLKLLFASETLARFCASFDDLMLRDAEGNPTSLTSYELTQLFDEFVGCESELKQLCDLGTGQLQIKSINRVIDNQIQYFDFHVTPILHHGQNSLILIIENQTEMGRLAQELTQERNQLSIAEHRLRAINEQLEMTNQVKALLMSIAAHDMLSPLNVISGYVELLDSLPPDATEEKIRFSKAISQQIDGVQRMVGDFLDMDAAESGDLSIELEPVSLATFAQYFVGHLEVMVVHHDLAFELNIDSNPMRILGDLSRLEQVLYNLVKNAVKFTSPPGKIMISITEAPERQAIRVSVCDDGIGIPPERRDRLFDLYYTEGDGRAAKQGHGIGLFVVKKILDAHNATIEVWSEVDQGSRFDLYFPIYAQ